MNKDISLEGGLRTQHEKQVRIDLGQMFENNGDEISTKLENFPKYVRRQNITHFLAQYELFKQVLNVKGSIVECGVFRGSGLFSWAHFSSILEPNNIMRKIYGFDTFSGFSQINKMDLGRNTSKEVKVGGLKADSYGELNKLIKIHDNNRFLGHVNKTNLIKGDVCKTIPEFIKDNPHLLVSLLYLDLDLYEPTRVAIENFLPRMPKGSIIAFDELDNRLWPGETLAVMETIGLNKLKIERFDFDPYIGFARIE